MDFRASSGAGEFGTELARRGRLIPSDPMATRQTGWAMVHGLISLRTARPHHAWAPELIQTAIAALLRGLIREDPAEPGAEGAR